MAKSKFIQLVVLNSPLGLPRIVALDEDGGVWSYTPEKGQWFPLIPDRQTVGESRAELLAWREHRKESEKKQKEAQAREAAEQRKGKGKPPIAGGVH